MRIVSCARELAAGEQGVSFAIGVFDGVHLGHQKVIAQALEEAKRRDGIAAVATFDRHPNALLAPAKAPKLIYSLEKRLSLFATLGVDAVLVLKFDEALSKLPAENFIAELARETRITSLAVGRTFTFGFQRKGNVELLLQLGSEYGFIVHAVPGYSLGGQVVSSTRIRAEIQSGNFTKAAEMLGRDYTLAGKVVEGAKLGTKLGIPTANIDMSGLALPPSGVYAANCIVGEESHCAVVNIGIRPTVGTSQAGPVVEAHILNFSGDLYGQEVELLFVGKLREEQKFGSLDDLRNQINRDIEGAKKLF